MVLVVAILRFDCARLKLGSHRHRGFFGEGDAALGTGFWEARGNRGRRRVVEGGRYVVGGCHFFVLCPENEKRGRSAPRLPGFPARCQFIFSRRVGAIMARFWISL